MAGKGGEIGTDNWNLDEQVVYPIFSFSNPTIHYHKNCNEFSHTVAGNSYSWGDVTASGMGVET